MTTPTEKLFFDLIRSVIAGAETPAIPEDADYRTLYRLADMHDLAHLAAFALDRAGVVPPDETAALFQKQLAIAVFRETKREALLYKLFGVNAELLIDHAWGYESCTMRDIHSYTAKENSLSSAQVLPEAYPFSQAKVIVKEMADNLWKNLRQQ